jgi:hypothetical protein
MEEDIFDIENDPEMVALAREAKDIQVPVSYVMPTFQPIPEPAQVTKKEPEKRESRPWLLSTKRTLSKAGVKFYEGLDFTMDRSRNRSVRFSQIYRVFTEVFHNTILPNAIIAERAGVEVSVKDVYEALHYAMRHGKTEETRKHWDDFKKQLPNTDAWVYENVTYPFNFYVKGILQKDGQQTVIPEDKRTTLDEYREKVIGKFVHLLKPMTYGSTPKLNILVNAFNGDRSIASLSYEELRDRFGVSICTIAAFKKWVQGRRDSGRPDADFLVTER